MRVRNQDPLKACSGFIKAPSLETHLEVLWAHHGAIAAHPGFMEAYDGVIQAP
jgi:hypothetical protein